METGLSANEVISTILSIAFGCWAGVIVWIGNGIRSDIKEESRKLNQYIVQTEKRLAVIETTIGLDDA